jgi:ubiquinone/menaquinone biosynthesis C-methylase UbiE
VLEPRPGERILEVGPGTGYYTLEVAECLSPGGQLDIFDLQQEMLEHTTRRADERGLTNVIPTQGDARQLPYADGTFDAAFLATVLGEIPDQDAALRELARVLKPGGWAVLQVPDVEATRTDEDADVTDPAERERRFGQHDHVRRYGWDYVGRLEEAGLSVVVERQETEIPPEIVEQCRLRKFGEVEPIFICHR